MERPIKEVIGKVAMTSNEFEANNTDLKRKYFARNIAAFNYIVSLINENRGSFGTGYPFTVLPPDLKGQLPIIKEQLRYNNELIEHVEKSKRDVWICEGCLTANYDSMPDLKQVCKPCPNMDRELKPRKIMNRLPDVDMWMVCEDGRVEESQDKLLYLLDRFGIKTSDVDPVQTIKDMEEITQNIKNGVMPKKFLPIDAHIIKYSTIKGLIQQVPTVLKQAKQNDQIPYLPIHPKSYRKTWQYDDEAYNFIYDFLSAFTEFNFNERLNISVKDTRSKIIQDYSSDELYNFLVSSASEGNKRRNETPELKKAFFDRIQTWKTRDLLDIYER